MEPKKIRTASKADSSGFHAAGHPPHALFMEFARYEPPPFAAGDENPNPPPDLRGLRGLAARPPVPPSAVPDVLPMDPLGRRAERSQPLAGRREEGETVNSKVRPIDAARMDRAPFENEPLKYLIPALKSLETVSDRALSAANVPPWFRERLVDTWRDYDAWLRSTDPTNWFTARGSIDPAAIRNLANARGCPDYHAWQAMREQLIESHDAREKLARAWQVPPESVQDTIVRAVSDADDFMNAFANDPAEIPF